MEYAARRRRGRLACRPAAGYPASPREACMPGAVLLLREESLVHVREAVFNGGDGYLRQFPGASAAVSREAATLALRALRSGYVSADSIEPGSGHDRATGSISQTTGNGDWTPYLCWRLTQTSGPAARVQRNDRP